MSIYYKMSASFKKKIIYIYNLYSKYIKNWNIVLVGLILSTRCIFASSQVIDKVSAVVDHDVILESEINSIINIIKNNDYNFKSLLQRQVLDNLIINSMILQLSQRIDINISNEELNQKINSIIDHNKITLNQLFHQLAYEDIDYNTYRDKIKQEIIIDKICDNEVRSSVTIFQKEVELLAQKIDFELAHSTQFNLSQILIPITENYNQNKLYKAEKLALVLKKIKKNSANVNQKDVKIDQIGWKKIIDLPLLFVEHLHNASKGSIIGPIRSSIGFYILKVNDIRSINHKILVTKVHARHIFLPNSIIMTDTKIRYKLENIATKIKAGSLNFESAAKKMSEYQHSETNSGDLGWVVIDDLDPIILQALMKLKQLEISMPVQSSLGLHVIQFIDKLQIDYTDRYKKELAYQLIFNRKCSEEKKIWMKEKRASTYVKVLYNVS